MPSRFTLLPDTVHTFLTFSDKFVFSQLRAVEASQDGTVKLSNLRNIY